MYLIGNRLFLHTLVFAAVLTISGSAPSSAQEPDICSANADNPAAAPISPATKPQYLTAFKRKVAEIQQQKPELLLLGDSITHNWENTGPDSSENLHAVWQRYF